MGSCCSKKKKKQGSDRDLRQENQSRCRDPPPTLPLSHSLAEETVKEVLSETAKPSFPNIKEAEKTEKKAPILINGGDEASELSEICSVSESESMSATTFTEKKGEEEEEGVGMRLKENRSPAKFQRKRPVPGWRSPANRSEPSPVRRMPVKDVQMHRAWVPAGSGGIRRDLGENSGRRSSSPLTRTDPATRNDLSRCASARKTCRSPRRIPAGMSEECGGKFEGSGALPASESLENPLVSLECFIFL